MLNVETLGYLNRLVSEERSKANQQDPYIPIMQIHIGCVHPGLEIEFIKAISEKQNFTLCEINGIPIVLNWLCGNEYKVIFKESDIPREITIGGIKPSKSWLKRYRIER